MEHDARTFLYGIIGHPAINSLSPGMHNAAFRSLGLNAVYLAFDTIDLEGAMRGARALGIRGMSITIPYKGRVIPLLDEIHPDALAAGAVNTVFNDNGRLKGMNTDITGSVAALRRITGPEGKRALIIGAGGAARAAALGLIKEGTEVFLMNRNSRKAEEAARSLGANFLENLEQTDLRFHIIINATPAAIGQEGSSLCVPDRFLKKGVAVMDMVYRPAITPFLAHARKRGCLIVSGLSMLFHQGVEQFRIWTGLEPPLEIMAGALCHYKSIVLPGKISGAPCE